MSIFLATKKPANMPVYNKRGILLLPKVIVLNPKDGGSYTLYKISDQSGTLQINNPDVICIRQKEDIFLEIKKIS